MNKPNRLHITPLPQQYAFQHGSLQVCSLDHIFCDGALSSYTTAQITRLLPDRAHTAFKGLGDKPGLYIWIDSNLSQGAESYQIKVTTKQLRLSGADQAGVLFGLQSLAQLLQQFPTALPCLEVVDYPRFAYRGMHLDVSRHFFPVDFIKRQLDLLALHKMNRFHWHLTDDQGWRIEIPGFEKLTSIGGYRECTVVGHTSDNPPVYDNHPHSGFYTREEILDVVAYADERGITVIPEIDVPGHAAALLAAYPEYACYSAADQLTRDYKVQSRFGIFTDVLCCRDDVFVLLEAIFSEVASLFPSEYIHIGGDEVKKQQWLHCDHCSGLLAQLKTDDPEALHSYFVERVRKLCLQLGKKIIGWDELIDGDVDPCAAIMSWRGIEGGIKAAQKKHPVIMTPVSATYFDFYQSTSRDEPMSIHGLTSLHTVYDFDPAPATLPADQASCIIGTQANLWTEYMSSEEQVESMLLPRLCALAEVAWTAQPLRQWSNFQQRLNTWLPQLQAAGYAVSDAACKPMATTDIDDDSQLIVSLHCDRDNCDIVYTLDGSEPTQDSARYSTPMTIDSPTTLRSASVHQHTGQQYGDEQLSMVPHLALNKPIRFAHAPDVSVSPLGGRLLVNGCLATDRIFQFHEWGGFDENGMDAVIDLQTQQAISSVSVGFAAGQYRRLYFPTGVNVFGSNDEQQWQCLATADEQTIKQSAPRLCLTFNNQDYQFIRVVAENNNRAYSEEDRSIIAMPIYIDEIIVH